MLFLYFRTIGNTKLTEQAATLFYIGLVHEKMGNIELAKSTLEKVQGTCLKEGPADYTYCVFDTRSQFYIGKFEYLDNDFLSAYNTLEYFMTRIGEEVGDGDEIEEKFKKVLSKQIFWKDVFEDDAILIKQAQEMIEDANTKKIIGE